MTQSKHTPAPWFIDDGNNIRADMGNDDECVRIAEYTHAPLGLDDYGTKTRPLGLEEAKANARLIAAAPEMLEYLEHFYDNTHPIVIGEESHEALGKLIAKATGC